MIKRFCDICGEELGKDYYSVKLPRIVRRKIRSSKCDAELGVFDKVDRITTDICAKCEYRLAMALPIVEND